MQQGKQQKIAPLEVGRGSDAGGAGPGWGGAWPGRGGAWPGGEQAQEVTAPVAERTRRRAGRGCRGCCGARTGAMENGAVYSPTTEENPGPARGSRSGLAAYCSLGRLPLLRRVLKGSQLVSRGAAGERGRPAWLPLGPRPSPASEGWGCSGRRRGARRFPASSLPEVLRLAAPSVFIWAAEGFLFISVSDPCGFPRANPHRGSSASWTTRGVEECMCAPSDWAPPCFISTELISDSAERQSQKDRFLCAGADGKNQDEECFSFHCCELKLILGRTPSTCCWQCLFEM